jgi:hypothetical protein
MEARLSLSLHDRVAYELFAVLPSGLPQLRVYRGSEIVFSGHWTPMRGSGSVDGPSTLDLVFRDAFSRLGQRYTDGSVSFVAEDAGSIAQFLIETAKDFGTHNIDTNPSWIEATKDRDRTYEYKNVAEAVIELTEVIGGFDWFPVYLDPRVSEAQQMTMEFHVAARIGQDRPTAIFEYGEGTLENCASYSFTTGLPINWVIAIGGGTPPFVEEAIDASSRLLYNTHKVLVSATDVVESETLLDKAQDALRPGIVHVTEFKPDPALAPLPWEDFWIGDNIRVNVDDGAFQLQIEPRVQTIEVGVDDSDNISDVVIGIDPGASGAYMPPANTTRAYVRAQRDLQRRLSALERL